MSRQALYIVVNIWLVGGILQPDLVEKLMMFALAIALIVALKVIDRKHQRGSHE